MRGIAALSTIGVDTNNMNLFLFRTFGLDAGKMQPLFDKHENANGISMETSTSERYGVLTPREYPLDGNSRT